MTSHSRQVITFDEKGISGHPNHISLYYGFKHWKSTCPDPQPRLYTLRTAPVWIKYSSVVAVLLAKVDDIGTHSFVHFSEYLADRLIAYFEMEVVEKVLALDKIPMVFASGYAGWWKGTRAMNEHTSRLVWFRSGWLAFLGHQWVNDLVKLYLSNVTCCT